MRGEMWNFLNNDKTIIQLPVPLGSTVYRIHLSSDNNRFIGTEEVQMTLSNLDKILNEWNQRTFAVKTMAEKQGKAIVKGR
jgi:hypothetical protein